MTVCIILHSVKDDWTVYLLTEQPATSKSNRFLSMYTDLCPGFSYKDGEMIKVTPSVDLGIYAQHHCWLLFNSLTLSMADAVNQTGGGEERGGDGRGGDGRGGEGGCDNVLISLQGQRSNTSDKLAIQCRCVFG